MKLFLEIPLQLHVSSLNWQTHSCFFLVPMLTCPLTVKGNFQTCLAECPTSFLYAACCALGKGTNPWLLSISLQRLFS